MSIKFEMINSTLCRMVEPTPLTEKSLTHYTPCAIRPIKDNTQIGKLNKRTIYSGLSNCDGVYILNERQIGTGSYKNMIYAPWGSAHAFEQFEIIGYPVVEGSAEWALYQMMQRKKVRYKGATGNVYWAINQCGNVQYYDMADPAYIGTIRSKLGFAEKNWGNYIWQIYEEPAPQYKVGDWVEYRLDGDTYYGKICNIRGYVYYFSVTTEEILKDQARAIMLERIIRKLSPSEVIVDFGSGIKGTVRSCEYDSVCVRVISGDRVIAHIMTDILEQPMRELVERLLIAQEEK